MNQVFHSLCKHYLRNYLLLALTYKFCVQMVNPGYIYLYLLTRATGMLHKHKLTLAKAKLLVL